jgi:hypothetical protein
VTRLPKPLRFSRFVNTVSVHLTLAAPAPLEDAEARANAMRVM